MPERLPYDEAMLFSSVRLKIQDPEIKQGKVETIEAQTKIGPVTRPWGIEGSFAVVYKFRTLSGQFRALRCFRVPMEPDTQSRYEQIEPYFHTHISEATAGFKYHDAGIMVKEQGQPQGQIYPIIEMDWVDGTILINKIDELCQKQDRTGLQALNKRWTTLLYTLRNAQIAHGDLAGTNIMVCTDGRLVLIDYDGVYIPSFAGKNPVLLGQPDYQHPKMAQRKFDEHMDAFSALAISVILLALSLQPDLWDKYMPRNDGKLLDNNLMFMQKDFQEPLQSPLFQELETLPDLLLKALLQELKRACSMPVEQMRFPFHLLDPDYDKKQALTRLEQALSTNDDELIVQCWTPELAKYSDALVHLPHVKLAQQRRTALAQFRVALQKGNTAQIIASYNPLLDQSKNISRTEREQLTQARRIQDALTQLKAALADKNIARIAAVYTTILDGNADIPTDERSRITLARMFNKATQTQNDDDIVKYYDSIQNSPHSAFLLFTPEEELHVQQARKRYVILEQFRAALNSKQARRIVTIYYDKNNLPIVSASTAITTAQREVAQLAYNFLQQLGQKDEEGLLATYALLQQPPYDKALDLTANEQLYVQKLQGQKEALTHFVDTLDNGTAQDIDSAYKNLPTKVRARLSTEQRAKADSMANYVNTYQKLKDAIAANNSKEALRLSTILSTNPVLNLTKEENGYIAGIKKAVQIEMAIRMQNDQQALKMAKDIQRQGGGNGISALRSQLSGATQRLILAQKHELEAVKAFVKKEPRRDTYKLIFTWIWPKEDLIRDAIIIYSPYEAPPVFREIQEVNCQYRGVARKTQEREREEMFPLEAIYTGRANATVYWRVCTLIRDDWDNSLARGKNGQYKHYLSPGISGQVYVR